MSLIGDNIRFMNSMLDLYLILVLFAANPTVFGQERTAQVGSAIVGIITPDELLLFTDSASSTVTPVAGSNSQRADEKTRKLWRTNRLIWAQAGLQTMTVDNRIFDFDEPARLLLTTSGPFDPGNFRDAWLPEVERPLTAAFNEDKLGFTNLVDNGVKGVEIVVGWFDAPKRPHFSRIRVVISISPVSGLKLKTIYTEFNPPRAGIAQFMLAAQAADIGPRLTANTERYSKLKVLVSERNYADAAKLIIDYAAKYSSEIGGPIQEATLRRADLN
jgi:hypothetical protein